MGIDRAVALHPTRKPAHAVIFFSAIFVYHDFTSDMTAKYICNTVYNAYKNIRYEQRCPATIVEYITVSDTLPFVSYKRYEKKNTLNVLRYAHKTPRTRAFTPSLYCPRLVARTSSFAEVILYYIVLRSRRRDTRVQCRLCVSVCVCVCVI
jgi:hypothetical protein